MDRSVWIGYDPREANAFAVARHSIKRKLNVPIAVKPVILSALQAQGLYHRETIRNHAKQGAPVLFDVISEHPMATEFAISRFLVPQLVKRHTYAVGKRWAVFMDCDILCRRSIEMLFAQAKEEYAVMVVKHDFNPVAKTKMDGQVQSRYQRKNWSSVMLFNVDHPSNAALTVDLVNSVPGRDLHAFCWLKDEEIGELHAEWNYLVGHHTKYNVVSPSIVHFTDGIPTMPGYEDCEYADEWFGTLEDWAR